MKNLKVSNFQGNGQEMDPVDRYLTTKKRAKGRTGKEPREKKYQNLNTMVLSRKRRQKSVLQEVFDEITKNKNLPTDASTGVKKNVIVRELMNNNILANEENVDYMQNLSTLRGYTKKVPIASSIYKKPIRIVFFDPRYVDNKITDDCYYWYDNFIQYSKKTKISADVLSMLTLTDVRLISNEQGLFGSNNIRQCHVIDFNVNFSSPFIGFISDQNGFINSLNQNQSDIAMLGRTWVKSVYENVTTWGKYQFPTYFVKGFSQEEWSSYAKTTKFIQKDQYGWLTGTKTTKLDNDVYLDTVFKPKNYGTKAVMFQNMASLSVLYICECDFDNLLSYVIKNEGFDELEVGTFDNIPGIMSIFELGNAVSEKKNESVEKAIEMYRTVKPQVDYMTKIFKGVQKLCFSYLNAFIKKVNIDSISELKDKASTVVESIIEVRESDIVNDVSKFIEVLTNAGVKCDLMNNFMMESVYEIPSLIRNICMKLLSKGYVSKVKASDLEKEVKAVAMKIFKCMYYSEKTRIFQEIRAFASFLGSLSVSDEKNTIPVKSLVEYLEKIRSDILKVSTKTSKLNKLAEENKTLLETNSQLQNMARTQINEKLNEEQKKVITITNKMKELLNQDKFGNYAAQELFNNLEDLDKFGGIDDGALQAAMKLDTQAEKINSNKKKEQRGPKYNLIPREFKPKLASERKIEDKEKQGKNKEKDDQWGINDFNWDIDNENEGEEMEEEEDMNLLKNEEKKGKK